jgi:HPt (histidine-containing phosphotransfer) domain-containing protein
MAPRKEETPLVATFADYEMITPPNELRKAVAVADDDDDDPVARAEVALRDLSVEFSGWMQAECERLEAARRDVNRLGFNETTRDGLFRTAHDIKGEAATFGFPEVAAVAESLCRLIEHAPDIGQIPLQLIDQHVDAVRAITREYDRPDLAELAGELAQGLRLAADDFLKRENGFRPDYLESIFAPPLAPGVAES